MRQQKPEPDSFPSNTQRRATHLLSAGRGRTDADRGAALSRLPLSKPRGPPLHIATQITPAQLQVPPSQCEPYTRPRRPSLGNAPSCGRPARRAQQVYGGRGQVGVLPSSALGKLGKWATRMTSVTQQRGKKYVKGRSETIHTEDYSFTPI